MTASPVCHRSPASSNRPAPLAPEAIWQQSARILHHGAVRDLPLTNFAGRNYLTLDDGIMALLLGIEPHERVLDIGGGDAPFSRANVVTDAFPDMNAHRSGRTASVAHGVRFVECFAEDLPFADGEFDVAYCRMVLEHAIDPAAACREMMRVARRGFLETPSPWAEYLGGHPTHRWIVSVEDADSLEPTLVFRRKPFVCSLFHYVHRPLWFNDPEFNFQWEWQHRNLLCTQLAWSGSFRFRVEETPGINYDDPTQAAEAHLEAALNALNAGGSVPMAIILPDIEQALAYRPDWAVAHNAHGIALWSLGRQIEAENAFREAARLEPENRIFAQNVQLATETGQNRPPQKVGLPLLAEQGEATASNFAGSVYHAGAGDEASLQKQLELQPHETVLHIGTLPFPNATASLPRVSEHLPFADGAFDIVICREGLERCADPVTACRELQRVARRGLLEAPNAFREAFAGRASTRWLADWNADSRTLTFQPRPFGLAPFRNALLPALSTQPALNRAFEQTYRNLTMTQVAWDEKTGFNVQNL